ncbi:MAG: hypothetical protein CM1200mP29_10550 [Verrucomicrobiota bacterium]|nr:MAG: hypothetical protein CM1200mP29_10550 [Verrucomicrobiota bacterium]
MRKMSGRGIAQDRDEFFAAGVRNCESATAGATTARLSNSYKGRNVADVLDMTWRGDDVFSSFPKICDPCATLSEVGVGTSS